MNAGAALPKRKKATDVENFMADVTAEVLSDHDLQTGQRNKQLSLS